MLEISLGFLLLLSLCPHHGRIGRGMTGFGVLHQQGPTFGGEITVGTVDFVMLLLHVEYQVGLVLRGIVTLVTQ